MVRMGMRNNYKIQIFKMLSIEAIKSTVGFGAVPRAEVFFGKHRVNK
jgi:hypothetical protein